VKSEAYEKNYEYEDDYWWFRVRNRLVFEKALHFSSGRRIDILDYGCGTGKMMQDLSQAGNVWGCDMSVEALSYCRKRGLDNLIDISGGHEKLGQYDVITLLDVLEHVDDDEALLRTLKMHIKPGGRLIITVPAFNCLWSGEDNISLHKRRYRKKMLFDIVSKCGLRPVKSSYFNMFLLLPIFLFIKYNMTFRPESREQSNLRKIPCILNKTFEFIFGMELPLLRRFDLPLGTSILCIAENNGENYPK